MVDLLQQHQNNLLNTYFLNSIKEFFISSNEYKDKSMFEKPGVSSNLPSKTETNSTKRVVCFPLPRATETSPTSNFKLGSNKLNKVDLPAPVCPVKTVVLSLNIFLKSSSS